jgi:hypothetical protein
MCNMFEYSIIEIPLFYTKYLKFSEEFWSDVNLNNFLYSPNKNSSHINTA